MSDAPLLPQNVSELQSMICTQDQLIAVGNETKKPLSHCEGATRVSLRQLTGITQYEPSEYTFTVSAGTRLNEIVDSLGEKQQYLPFDPLLSRAGATIGGTVASGLSGPGRFRYGGIRDFLLAVEFIRGDGKRIRAGGNVVKNAAGFDLPKFLVGSLGRFGVITEMTFKVFPKPECDQTIHVVCASHQQAVERMSIAACETWELDAIDYRPSERLIEMRIAGPATSNREIANQIAMRWGTDVSQADAISRQRSTLEGASEPPGDDSENESQRTRPHESWHEIQDLSIGGNDPIVAKIPTTQASVEPLSNQLPGQLRFSAAANVLWHFVENELELLEASHRLSELGLPGLVVKGPCSNPFIGAWPSNEIQDALKHSFDPERKFPSLIANAHVA